MMTLNLRVFFALFIVFGLSILPLPHMMMAIRPPWVLLFVLYIQFYLPNYFSVTLLLLLGLCLDVLLSTMIGEHAFALILAAWFAASKTRRFNFFSMVQQMMLVASFCLIYQLTIFLIDAFLGYHNEPMMVIGTTILSMFFWPWARVLADGTLT